MFGPLKIFHFFKLVSFVLFFFVTENRQLLGELNGIDTLLQCLSVSSLSKIFFSSVVYKDNSSKLMFRKLLFKQEKWTVKGLSSTYFGHASHFPGLSLIFQVAWEQEKVVGLKMVKLLWSVYYSWGSKFY